MNKDILKQLGFTKELNRISIGFCPLCNNKIYLDEFKDTLSEKEYRISGLCQKCQDKMFER